jgi:hypothetical protein
MTASSPRGAGAPLQGFFARKCERCRRRHLVDAVLVRRLLAALCAFLSSTCLADAQLAALHAGRNPTAASYVGPFDALGAAQPVAYSIRAASAAIAAAGTQPLVQVGNASTTPANVTCDILPASNGRFGLTANCSSTSPVNYNGMTAAAFCTAGGGSCYWTIARNQGTAGTSADLPIAFLITSRAPTLNFNCDSGPDPCFQLLGSSSQSMVGTWPATAQPFNYSAVAERTPTSNTFMTVVGNSNLVQLGFDTTSAAFIYAGTLVTKPATDASWHAIQETFNTGATSAINIDGTDTTGLSVGANTISGTANESSIGSQGPGSTNFFTGNWRETIVSGVVAWSSTQRGNLCTNQNGPSGWSSMGLPC